MLFKRFSSDLIQGFKERKGFVRPNQPFPLNPYFKPNPPISNQTKQAIYQRYLEKSTPRQLAEEYGLGLERVNAILRLKALEKQNQEKGIPIETHLCQGMESYLGAIHVQPDSKREPLRQQPGHPLKPFLQFVDEQVHVTPQEAAEWLNLKPIENTRFKVDKEAQPSQVLSQDEKLGGKTAFMFVDKNKMLIRETNGTLRTATSQEAWTKKHGKPKHFRM